LACTQSPTEESDIDFPFRAEELRVGEKEGLFTRELCRKILVLLAWVSGRRAIIDRLGHEIYLTEERWQHICDEHPEMEDYPRQVEETVRMGRRFQDSVRPQVYLYYRNHRGLPNNNTTMVVVVRFGFNPDGSENNFIMTAYQIYRRRGGR
jgi:hypothetical protein